MTVTAYSYTIYHSPNAYLGTVLLRRAIAQLPEVQLVRRPIYVPRERGLMIAEMLGGKENRNVGSYLREDCRRWSERFAIPFVYPHPEVFHQRAAHWPLLRPRGTAGPRLLRGRRRRAPTARSSLVRSGMGRGSRRQRAGHHSLGSATRRPRLRRPDDEAGRTRPRPGGASGARGVRPVALSRCSDRRRRWPALLWQGPGRLGGRRLPRAAEDGLTLGRSGRQNCRA